MNTIENPATKLMEWEKMGQRLASADSEAAPPKLARYMGTSGSTQGEIKDTIPAPKATGNETSVIGINPYEIWPF
jgi:hypothetical protein